jgi:hypothetical protein
MSKKILINKLKTTILFKNIERIDAKNIVIVLPQVEIKDLKKIYTYYKNKLLHINGVETKAGLIIRKQDSVQMLFQLNSRLRIPLSFIKNNYDFKKGKIWIDYVKIESFARYFRKQKIKANSPNSINVALNFLQILTRLLDSIKPENIWISPSLLKNERFISDEIYINILKKFNNQYKKNKTKKLCH